DKKMQMRWKILGLGLFLALCLVTVAGAQGPSAEWTAWNTQITAHNNSSQLDVAETQIVNVTSGPLQGGERTYTQPVNIQAVYVAMNGGQPQQMTQGNGPGTYQVNSTSDTTVLDYTLPTTANSGDNFTIQTNFTTTTTTPGLIDWYAVPVDHPTTV